MLKRIRADEVVLGMYVRKFTGSWLQHPFWRAKMLVQTEKVLTRIRDAGLDCVIDVTKGLDVGAPVAAAPAPQDAVEMIARRLNRAPSAAPAPAAPPRPPMMRAPAKVTAPFAFGKADKARASALAQRSSTVVKALFDGAAAGGTVSPATILPVVDDIASTLEQTSAAFISVTRLKTKDDGTYTHSVAVCALMIGLARELGLSGPFVRTMGTAGLLHDIGKVTIDDAILAKSGALSDSDIAAIRQHPGAGHAMLEAEEGLAPEVLDVCLNHHERLDGTGYPARAGATKISLAVRMATICDAYEAMTSSGAGERTMVPVDAIAEMESCEGQFDPMLLFKFMRSIGVFPTGRLVRLRSNRLAVILASAGEDRRPMARAFFSTIDTAFTDYEDVILSDRLSDDQPLGIEDPASWFRGDWSAMYSAILGARPLTAQMVGMTQATAA